MEAPAVGAAHAGVAAGSFGRTKRIERKGKAMDWLKIVHGKQSAPQIAFGAGDDVRVWFRILEQGKERLAHFEGVVVRVRGSGASKTFTVRRLTHGEGVERVFPVGAKILDRVEVLRRGKVHRGRIYFLRTLAKRMRLESSADRESAGQGEPTAPDAALGTSAPGTERATDDMAASDQPTIRPAAA